MLQNLNPRIKQDLLSAIDAGLRNGDLHGQEWVQSQCSRFLARFDPKSLAEADGLRLLTLMHGRGSARHGSLVFWLEYKNDEEFTGSYFGGIKGGYANKFGLSRRADDSEWVRGSGGRIRPVSEDEAISVARSQRNELLAGVSVLDAFARRGDVSDMAYGQLQQEMAQAAPTLSGAGWAHKYWTLCFPEFLDGFHSAEWQRFYLVKLLQMPPDERGPLEKKSVLQRFVCAGRFVTLARELELALSTLCVALTRLFGARHRYWRIGTTAGNNGESQWDVMRSGEVVSIGWADTVPDLSPWLANRKPQLLRKDLTDILTPFYKGNVSTASRKAGEITDFACSITERDIVFACNGMRLLGIGQVTGKYRFDESQAFPHLLPVQWLWTGKISVPDMEGNQTTVYQIGASAKNVLQCEALMLDRAPAPIVETQTAAKTRRVLPPLDPLAIRVDDILNRKGQAIFYGPPGTGKTYTALRLARELAARRAFNSTYDELDRDARGQIEGPDGFVRLCTFHPGWGYEDFVEGLRPAVSSTGQMVFAEKDGVFKKLCDDASANTGARFFLVIDEINRGDLPRIFGELLTTLEIDKRDLVVTLPLTRKPFTVPSNVHILGTMNTADRSITLLDAAFRRRFGFVELMPDATLISGRPIGGLNLGRWLNALNERLRRHLKRDARNLQIGHAYLMPPKGVASPSEFARILRDDIIPLIEEYCYDDFAMLKRILGSSLVDEAACRIREELFDVERESELIQAISFEELANYATIAGEDTVEGDDEAESDETDEGVDSTESV